MDAVLYGAAVAAFVVAAVSYFHGFFRIAFLLGCGCWTLLGMVVLGAFPAALAWPLLLLFAIGPALFVVVHAVDARRGCFRLPTIYSIPIAFLLAAALLVAAGLGVLLA